MSVRTQFFFGRAAENLLIPSVRLEYLYPRLVPGFAVLSSSTRLAFVGVAFARPVTLTVMAITL